MDLHPLIKDLNQFYLNSTDNAYEPIELKYN